MQSDYDEAQGLAMDAPAASNEEVSFSMGLPSKASCFASDNGL